MIEAATAVKAIEFAQNMGLTNAILEGDALNIVNQINLNSQDLSAVGNLIEEARFMRRNFQMYQIKFVRREANVAAHVLAKPNPLSTHMRKCTGLKNALIPLYL